MFKSEFFSLPERIVIQEVYKILKPKARVKFTLQKQKEAKNTRTEEPYHQNRTDNPGSLIWSPYNPIRFGSVDRSHDERNLDTGQRKSFRSLFRIEVVTKHHRKKGVGRKHPGSGR